MKQAPQFSEDILRACGDYASVGFQPLRYRRRNGLMLVIDDNFKIFCMPFIKTMDYELLGPSGKVVERGMAVNRPGKNNFHTIIQAAERYLSKTGTMYTYASINLKTKTGVGPLTGKNIAGAIRDFLGFERNTSMVYPFAVEYPSDEQIEQIAALCASDDTDAIYEACEKVLGKAPGL